MSRQPTVSSGLRRHWRTLVRLIGVGLLVWLLLRIDIKGAWQVLSQVQAVPVLLAGVLLLPLIGLKALRWLIIMGQRLTIGSYGEATLAYFSGLFLGFLTPGRLGEFVRVIYARRQLDEDTAMATISVLVDRLFDLAALLIFGGLAFLKLPTVASPASLLGRLFIGVGAAIPLVLLAISWGDWWSRLLGQRQFTILRVDLNRWLGSLASFRSSGLLLSLPITIIAYGLFFWQGQLLLNALFIEQGYLVAAFTLSLAGLVALLPISISGLGTREWVVTLYLGSLAVSAENAVAFSALVFLVFNLWGSLLGGLSWLLYPESFKIDSSEDLGTAVTEMQANSKWADHSSARSD